MKIQDSVIIVTGASGGIGLAVAKALADKGAKVVLAARSENKLTELESEIPNSYAVVTDMRQLSDIKNLIEKTQEKFGRIDALINNAGQGMMSPLESIDMKEYRDIMELNVFSVVEAMQLVIPVMRTQGAGTILNVSSRVSKNYYPRLSAYASTKYALNALSLTAREELKDDGIVVSVFHPKMTATDFGKNAHGASYNSSAGRPGIEVDTAEEVADEIVKQLESGDAEAEM
jgi:short-subunit dehydrogenase